MKIILILMSLCSVLSCKNTLYIDSYDDFMRMGQVISLYTTTYAHPPETADDLMIFIERSGTNTFDTYGNQYSFLDKNANRLKIVVTDSMITMYDKYIDPNRIVIFVSNETDYAYKKPRKNVKLFDKQGYYLISDSISNELFCYLDSLNHKYADVISNNGRFEMIMIEYINNISTDLTNDVLIDYNKSEFYAEVHNLLKTTANKNDLSRIIIPCFAEIESMVR